MIFDYLFDLWIYKFLLILISYSIIFHFFNCISWVNFQMNLNEKRLIDWSLFTDTADFSPPCFYVFACFSFNIFYERLLFVPDFQKCSGLYLDLIFRWFHEFCMFQFNVCWKFMRLELNNIFILIVLPCILISACWNEKNSAVIFTCDPHVTCEWVDVF